MSRWLPTSIGSGDVLSFAAVSDELYVAVDEPDGTIVYMSNDGGDQWEPVSAGTPSDITALSASRSGVLVGTAAGNLHRFNGKAWSTPGARPVGRAITHLVVHGDHLFAATRSEGVLRSGNGGETWQSVNRGLPLDGNGLDVYAIETAEGVLFADHSFGIHRSGDLGETWTSAMPVIPASATTVLLGAASTGVFVRAAGLHVSTDRGESWLRLSSDDRPPFFVRHVAFRDDQIYVGSTGEPHSAVYGSADGGRSWERMDSGLPPSRSVFVACRNRTLFAGPSGYGLWRCTPEVPAIPLSRVHQFTGPECEPNPCIDRTRITFWLPEEGHVLLEVRSILDQPLLTIINTVRPAGHYAVDLDARFLPDGIYYCRLTVSQMSMNRRLVVLRV